MKLPIERASQIADAFVGEKYDTIFEAKADLARMIDEEMWGAITEDRLARSAPDVPVQISTTQIES